MALAGPRLALHSNGQEDVDFFDQLANDLGQGEIVHQNFEKEVDSPGEALSKLSINDGDPAVAAAFLLQETGIRGGEIWMQERARNTENPAVATIGGLIEATHDMLESAAVMHSNTIDATLSERSGMGLCDAPFADTNVLEADAGALFIVPSEEEDLQDHALHQDSIPDATLCDGSNSTDLNHVHGALGNAGVEPTTNVSANSNSLQSDLIPPNDPEVKKPYPSQPHVKELQWSIFSEIYTPEEGPNVLNDFLSELDAGTGAVFNQSLPAFQVGSPTMTSSNTPSEWKSENGNLADQSILAAPAGLGDDIAVTQLHDGNGIYGIQNQREAHQSQVESTSSAFFSYYGTSEQPLGDYSIEQGGNGLAYVGDTRSVNHDMGVQLQIANAFSNEQEGGAFLQQSEMLRTDSGVQDGSLGGGQLHGGSHTINSSLEAEQQVNLTQYWDSAYPGWYFDYTSNQWKQIEGWDFTTGSMAVESHVLGSSVGLDSYATSSTVDAIPSHSEPRLNQATGLQMSSKHEYVSTSGYNEATDGSGSGVHEQPNPTGLVWPVGQEGNTPSTSGSPLENEQRILDGGYEQRAFDGNSQSQLQVPWEEQYPGWYFDYQAQQWQQIATDSNQFPIHGHSSNIETSQIAGDSMMQPAHQLGTDNNAYWPEENSVVYDNGGDKATLTQDLSFHAWGGSSAVATILNDVNAGTENVKTAFQFENVGSGYGLQNLSHGVPQYRNQSETHETSGNKSSLNFYSPYQYNQSHNVYGPVTGTKQFTVERPSHPLVAFGFGGKFVTMKASSSNVPETIVLHDLNQLVLAAENSGQNSGGMYFSCLNRGGLVGPLVGGGITTKEVSKWIDDRVANCDLEIPQGTSVEALRVLWGVLKIACSHYGKLRSMHGSSSLKSQSEDGPELDLGRLLSAASRQSDDNQAILASAAGLQLVPTENQLQAIGLEMKRRLVDGKRKEALQLAQQGQLWGPALVLAWHLGEKVYAETVLQMTQQQFVPGSPLRTLFLLFGGQTAELFTTKSLVSAVGATGPDSQSLYNNVKDNAGGMLADWMGNLSIIAANPTNGDEQVITHLGDCLWKDHGEVAGAHTCYLVADANFESYSENARLCLVGADHFKWQRTFATATSIQRTELYEYAKSLGNPQFTLLPFQPYKLLYAYMLVEAGRISEAHRYCQTVTKTLKNAGRGPEIEFCRQSASALEERLRLHSQGGYNLNSATGKLVGKFIGTLDSTLHRIIGGAPPRQASEPSLNKDPRDWYSRNSAKLAKASMLDRSVPNENLSRSNNRQVEAPPRSVSEPNLSWSPVKKDHNTDTSSKIDGGSSKETKNESGGASYLGRFGSQLLSKAVGFIKLSKKEADLGDKNKFYYNKDLKKWVEEGAEQTTEEVALPPPPIVGSFYSNSNGGSALLDAKVGAGTKGPGGSLSSSTEMPPLPPSGNQLSARGRRHDVRSRYVDPYNKGGTPPVKSTDSPLVPTAGWGLIPPPTQFFIPAHTATPTDVSDECLLNSWSASSTMENSQMHSEREAQLPKDVFLSGELPHSNITDNITNPSGSLATQSSSLPNGSKVEFNKNLTGMKLDTYMHAAAQEYQGLPVPPIIKPPMSSAGVENGLFGNSDEHLQSGLPGSVQGGFFTDMQEVEL
eukprot:c24732_g1_i2 orf=274-5169(+)